MFGILKDNLSLLKNGFLLHCYSHSVEMETELEKAGAYFSFGGTSTYSGSKKARRCISVLGLTRLLTETDSPYMAPVPLRGTVNTPLNIPLVVAKIAELTGKDVETAEAQLRENTLRLFTKIRRNA